MLFGGDKKKVMEAVDRNDVAYLRGYLDKHPKLLNAEYDWSGFSGFLLNYAAFRNKPDVIQMLVVEKGADPNRNAGVANEWTPLHHAEKKSAHRAAAKLVQLGADPSMATMGGDDTRSFVQSDEVQSIIDPDYAVKKEQKRQQEQESARARRAAQEAQSAAGKAARLAGRWTLNGTSEVIHEYETPDGGQKLTDIFNFETRIWRAVVTDLNGKGMAQNIVFFDQLPDGALLHTAFQKLKELGGDADESALPASAAFKKPARGPFQP